MTDLRIVLAADEAAGERAMRMVERSGHALAGVAARRPVGDPDRSLWGRATAAGVPCFDAKRLTSAGIAAELGELRPDVLLNVHSLHKVHRDVLELFGVGAWNLHPGPLPEAAGINVPSWAIALGHRRHGVTLHRMTENYDEGAVAYEDRFPIAPDATGLRLSAECGRRGLVLVQRLLEQLAVDPAAVPRVPQDLSQRRFFSTGQPNDGVIEWTSPAEVVDAHVRAADFRPFTGPWKAPRAVVGDETRRLLEVAVDRPSDAVAGSVARDGDRLMVAAADNWVRIVDSEEVARCGT